MASNYKYIESKYIASNYKYMASNYKYTDKYIVHNYNDDTQQYITFTPILIIQAVPDNNGEDDQLGDAEFDAEMVSKVREKLKRTAEDKLTEDTSKDSIEDVFSYNRSKKRKLVYDN